MSKPMVEKYEQILREDPTSTVFVELAKALLEQGQHERAIEICKGGLEHHRRSVVGRVLWGKALINLGRPAEAMKQFDQAVAIDKENPHAYNLIGEVLLRKGLYRSALPLLKKAVMLQPNDARVRQWLDQTKRALTGGPAPVLADFTDADPPEGGVGATEVMQVPGSLGDSADPVTAEVPKVTVPPEEGMTTDPMAAVASARVEPKAEPPPPPPEDDPFDRVPLGGSGPQVVMGLTATFDALAAPLADEPTIIPSEDFLTEARKAQPLPESKPERKAREPEKAPEKKSFLEDIPSAVMEAPRLDQLPPAPPEDEQLAPAASSSGGGLGLLDEVPELSEARGAKPPKPSVSAQASEAIAKEYEKELRKKLAEKAAKKTFLQRNGVKLAVGAVLFAVLCAFAGSYLYTWTKNRGKDLAGALGDAKLAIAQDTSESLKSALESLEHAIQMDERNTEAWALKAYAHSLRLTDHGGGPEDRQKALEALSKDGVRQAAPGFALLVDWALADSSAKEALDKELIGSASEQTEVKEAAGRLLFSKKKTDEGLKRLARALELLPGNVRAMVALGEYYLDAGDLDNALKFFAGPAAQLSPRHVARVVGASETRLAMQSELEVALKEMEALPNSEAAPELAARRQLALGRLLAANGRYAEGVNVLAQGEKSFKDKLFEFKMAQGQAARSAGKMWDAQRSFEEALKLRSKSEEAKEALARVLIARDREREALKVLDDGATRRLHMVRGVALSRLGEWKKARAELARTELKGKYPAEAVVYLALADANEEDPVKAEEILEKALKTAKRGKAEIRVALATVYRQRGRLDKAKEQLEEAAKEPTEAEAPCGIGRMLLDEGKLEQALAFLEKSVSRNGSHGEARFALVRTYLALGRAKDAVTCADEWVAENPTGLAYAGQALAYLASGEPKKAEQPAAKAVKYDPQSPAVNRAQAVVLFSLGETKAAFGALERANKLDPKDPLTFCEIAFAFLRQGNGEMAEKAFEAAGRDQPNKLGCALVGPYYARAPGGGKAAARELAKLSKDLPSVLDRAFAFAALARVNAGMGALKEASEAAAEAVTLAPGMGIAHMVQGLVAARQKDAEAAIAALERAVALDDSLGAAHLALGDAFARKDELDKAVDHYRRFLRIGGSDNDVRRADKAVTALRKKLAKR